VRSGSSSSGASLDVKMTDVADGGGVGVATLYRRFSTKTDLAITAGTLLWRRFNERIPWGSWSRTRFSP
jgi:hypothetical protein